MTRRTLSAGFLAAFLGALAAPASALQTTLEDPFPANTKVRIETRITGANPTGMYFWEVDSIPHVHRQWFWYRIGTTAESDLGSLMHHTSPLINDTNSNGYDDELVAEGEAQLGALLIDAHLAANAAGITPTARPEDTVLDPATGERVN